MSATLVPNDRATRYAVVGTLLGALGCLGMVLLTRRDVQTYGEDSLSELGYFFAALAAVPTVLAAVLLVIALLLGRESGRMMMVVAAVVGVVAALVPWGAVAFWLVG